MRVVIYEAATGRIRWTISGPGEQTLFDAEHPDHEGLAALPVADDGQAVHPDRYSVVDGALMERSAADQSAAAHARAWGLLRSQRNARLAASDRQVLPDRWAAMTAPQQAAWTAYRQALRDLPSVTPDPTTPPWPADPSRSQTKE